METLTDPLSWFTFICALVGAPLVLGIVNRVKAFFGGRLGQSLLQPYFDLLKLFGKGAVYSKTTSWVFRAGPLVGLACVVTALFLLPIGNQPALISFPGDFLLLAGLLATMRFFTVIAALDTGSSFEGMGASREVSFSALAEPVLLVSFASLVRLTQSLSLSGMFARVHSGPASNVGPALALVVVAIFIVFLVENARIPVDDPNTHLELTMIHEVMVLDHSGPDLAFVFYGAALKLWILAAVLSNVVFSRTHNVLAVLVGILAMGIVVGILESSMARLRLLRVPKLLIGAGAVGILAFILVL